MSIPPVSDEDLAELVLGYLADEQLMTVYDEFLMASPHVDSHRNEYKRIWMKSLHSIVAEYWAIKIYVEKCKPFSLRKRLLQCSNLMEIFKFLVLNVDMKKILPYNCTSHKNRITQRHLVSNVPTTTISPKDNSNANNMDASNQIETTSLADLPGNNHFPARRKQMKVLVRDSIEAARLAADLEESAESSNPDSQPVGITRSQSEVSTVDNITNHHSNTLNNTSNPNDSQQTHKDLSSQQVNSFSNDFVPEKEVVNKQNVQEPNAASNSSVREVQQNPIESPKPINNVNDMIQFPKSQQYLIHVSNTKNITLLAPVVENCITSGDDGKIKIISDVKVDKNICKSKDKLKPLSLQCATRELPLQTIVVNGTPAYKPEPRKSIFTRDEIMAMPTLLVVSAPGPLPIPTNVVVSKCTTPATNFTVTSTGTTPSCLKPLIIDISDSPISKSASDNQNMPLLSDSTQDVGLIKTVDQTKNVSAPKDTYTQSKTNTPQCLPPSRKASSTPRRHSHIRVLDFTTPRRILHETVNENPVEVIVSRSPNLIIPNVSTAMETQKDASVLKIDPNRDDSATKENKVVPKKKINWDDDLRALALGSSQQQTTAMSKVPKKKKKISTKKSELANNKKATKSPKRKHSKKKQNVIDVDDTNEEPEKTVTEPTPTDKLVKPTINIITDWNNPPPENDKAENKPTHDAESETPESERLSTQNQIGLKLNISDILATPFKQALYDIQMDTPKFLRPDIPISDEPVSEIKITDIPTPRFFDTPGYGYPKPGNTVATPSSYSSRPTDYSSGGSYYKPDECDYVPRPEDLGSPIKYATPFKCESVKSEDSKNLNSARRSSRPIRKCAKNVSYCETKANILGKSSDVDASANEASIDSIVEKTTTDGSKGEIGKEIKKETKAKVENKRKSTISSIKKQKTPLKKTVQKQFMKIKPRSTPIKDSRRRAGNMNSSHSKSVQSRKRTVSREKITTPLAFAAPTKSRRKSSTPRKLHTELLTSSSESVDTSDDKSKETSEKPVQESDNEHIPLTWSDDGSLDARTKDANVSNEIEDISHIKAYIEHTLLKEDDSTVQNVSNSLHIDLVKTGFDIETAKSIERDLLDNPPPTISATQPVVAVKDNSDVSNHKDNEIKSKVTAKEDTAATLEDSDIDEIELSTYECNIHSKNYINCVHDHTIDHPINEPHKIKDNFTMEFCIEDDAILLKTTSYTSLLDEMPRNYDSEETEAAVSSISNFDRLYTPVKSSIRAQCREIFDSTLASLDTPMKSDSPSRSEITVSEIVLEVEQIETKKRKRASAMCSDETVESKRSKRESRLLPNIQNMDIESVLSKLHGP